VQASLGSPIFGDTTSEEKENIPWTRVGSAAVHSSPESPPCRDTTSQEKENMPRTCVGSAAVHSSLESLPCRDATSEEKENMPRTSGDPPVVHASPDSPTFRDATSEEREIIPRICLAFWDYQMKKGIKEKTARGYAHGVKRCFEYDGKAPAVMATENYRKTIVYTWEDIVENKTFSVALSKFAEFWSSSSSADGSLSLMLGKTPVAEELARQFALTSKSRRSLDYESAEEALAEDNLPEGWRVHRSKNARSLVWHSPGRRAYFSRKEVMHRLKPPDPPAIKRPEEGDTDEPERRSKKARQHLVANSTSDGGVESQDQVPRQSLRDVFSTPPAEAEVVSAKDKTMLAGVLVTFRQHIASNNERSQKTCDSYALNVFKVFSESGRSLEAIAKLDFAQSIAHTEDCRRGHGHIGTAMKLFSVFWREIGGYAGTVAHASRDILNKTLNVRPILRDIQKQCGHGGVCQRPKQQCDTCGSTILCSKHGHHETEDCREVFWATHSVDGKRIATLRNFMRPKAQSGHDNASFSEVL